MDPSLVSLRFDQGVAAPAQPLGRRACLLSFEPNYKCIITSYIRDMDPRVFFPLGPPPFAPPPTDHALEIRIKKLAEFAARNGNCLEKITINTWSNLTVISPQKET